ncbi:MAG: hypothetical protein WCT52_03205 [Candidatus Micrarchaeia archaeon]|jgi:hypothetical protein
MASTSEIKGKAASAARKAALWLLASAFVLLLSAALISHAFLQKFFEPGIYLSSLERHGLYRDMQKGMADLLSSRMPAGIKENVSATVSGAATEEYFKLQSTRLITNFLGFFSSKNTSLELVLDLSPIKAAFDSSPDPTIKSLAPEMPVAMDFGSQMKQTGQLEKLSEFRSQMSSAGSANVYAIAICAALLTAVFLLHPNRQEGAAKCLELFFNAGTSTFIGGIVFAFLTPVGLPMILGASSSSQSAANMIATVMGDVLYEVGILTMIYSLPFIAIGYGLPRVLKLGGMPPAQPLQQAVSQTPPPAQPVSGTPSSAPQPPASSPPTPDKAF